VPGLDDVSASFSSHSLSNRGVIDEMATCSSLSFISNSRYFVPMSATATHKFAVTKGSNDLTALCDKLDGNYSQATKPEEVDLLQTCVSRDRHTDCL